MHAIMFWGFLALFMGTVLATIDYDITVPLLGYKLLKGSFYLVYETVLDLFGLFFVLGLGMALWRRFVLRPDRIDPTARFAGALALLLVINVTGFVMEACRLAAGRPAWAAWSPVGWFLAQGMLAAGMSEGALRATHLSVWLFHAAVSLAFVAVIPYSYFVHLITTPLNIFFAKLGPRGAIAPIVNIEAAESFGVSTLEDFSWKRRLDFDACVECGRCQAACPAWLAGTALSPKQIIVKLKRHMHGELPGPIHGELIRPEELWACTTCMACVEECPAFIDIVDTIIDLRRYLALSEGALPSTAPQSLQNIQRANVAAINRYRFRKVITHCPHCFNTIKNEFPQFGGTYEVLHHSQVIDELLRAGRIRPRKALDATLAFHDSCYLGRYNGILEAPRSVARSVPGLRVVELPRNRARGLCCGGGGGHMWMEVKSKKRVNLIRVEEILEAKVDTVGTGCPFCLAMLDLGRKVKGADERLQVKDVSELVAESLE